MTGRFAGKTALVTGASRGVGKAIALRLAAEGAYVFAGYRARQEDAAKTLEALRQQGQGEAIPLDVRDAEATSDAVAKIVEQRGQLDVLVNNAGVLPEGLFALAPAQDWRDAFEVNLLGAVNCAKAASRPMIAKGAGAIVNVGSAVALRPRGGTAAYAASKAALLALTRSLAQELGPRGVRTNAVVLGFVSAGMGQRMDRRKAERAEEGIPLGRFGTAEEAAAAVAFLASDEASYVNGAELAVDGGLTL